MKSIDTWFAEYSQDHSHPLNQKFHYVCVPVILFSLLGLLWIAPPLPIAGFELRWSYVLIAGASIFYGLLHLGLAVVMLLFTLLFCLYFNFMEKSGWPLLEINIALFVVAWVGQFYGHKVEGKKPSFLTDMTYLFIGPLWVLKKCVPGF